MDTNDDVHHPGSRFGHRYQKPLLVCKSDKDRSICLVHITALDAQDVKEYFRLRP